MTWNRSAVAARIDHTLLAPHATRAEVQAAAEEAVALGCRAVCVSPSVLPLTPSAPLRIATVIGFPSGAHHSLVKGAEARLAVDQGASELDMVIDLGAAQAGDFNAVLADIVTVRQAAPDPVVLKVILETALFDAPTIEKLADLAVRAGADYVKTSTGFHPAGGASVEAVTALVRGVRGRARVKASGGIRDAATATRMLDAGADVLGLSASRDVLEGFPA